MVLSFTGHRPDKLNNEWTMNGPLSTKIYLSIVDDLQRLKPQKGIIGMAVGIDMIAATALYRSGIPFTAAIPFVGQESKWSEENKRTYNKLLSLAKDVVIVSPGGYSVEKMQIRNEWMVDNSNMLYAVWNGSKGGTKNCVMYARKQNKKIVYNPLLVFQSSAQNL